MNQLFKYLILFFALLYWTSCTEIIQIDINNSDPQIVVEAGIAEGEFARVMITKSIGLYDTDDFSGVENAVVTISDDAGKSEQLTMTKPGNYITTSMKGEMDRKYTLKVESEEKTITSESTIPDKVAIDSMWIVNSIYPGGGPPLFPGQEADFYEVFVRYKDPVEIKNYYRILLYVNDTLQNRNYISDDRLTNGNKVENQLIVYNPGLKKSGKIRVELQCIDKPVYEYFKSTGNSSMGPGNSSSPANPYSNLKGTMLGYFSAHTVERRELKW